MTVSLSVPYEKSGRLKSDFEVNTHRLPHPPETRAASFKRLYPM